MTDASSLTPRILTVTVRYRMPVPESATLNSLAAAFAKNPALHRRYTMLLWDNSPEPLLDPPANTVYQHDATNSGITGAFNSAAAYAQANGYEWILLLDQDSDLPNGFLEAMADAAVHVNAMEQVAAVVPNVYVKDFLASPHRVLLGRHVPYPAGDTGIAPGEATAINSASMLRVRDLLAVGGYIRAFQQEYSDWYIFHQIYLAGKKVWGAGVSLQHEMTVMDYDRLLSVKRYRELLDAEEAFVDLYRCRTEGALQTVRLLARTVKQRFKWENPEYSRISFRRFLRRLHTTRKHRLAIWRADGEARAARYTAGASN